MTRVRAGTVPTWESFAEEAARSHTAERGGLGAARGLVLFLIVLAGWWPVGDLAGWKSDDFLAIHYTSDLLRALADFTGNQYGLEGIVWFYRPLISLSLAVEQLLAGGPSATLAQGVNAIVHAANAVLVALLALRWCGVRENGAALTGAWTAFCLALVWGLSPSHAGSVWWVVGRVDSHTTFWIFACLLAVVRRVEGAGAFAGVAAVVTFVLALASKESAIAVPPIAALVGYSLGRDRLRAAWRASRLLWLVAAAYLGLRYALFGSVGGGYEGELRLVPMLRGWFESSAAICNPLRYAGSQLVDGAPPWLPWCGYVPIALAVIVAIVRRRSRALVTLLTIYVVACVPIHLLLEHSGNLMNLRVFYAPSLALLGVLGLGGVVPCVLAIAIFALPMLAVRADWSATAADVKARHERLLDMAPDLPDGPVFVAGLPEVNAAGTVVAMHLGVDRLLRPPFAPTDVALYALRPLARGPSAFRVPYGDDVGVPLGTTLGFAGPRVLALLPPGPDRAVARLEVRVDGSLEMGTRRLFELGERLRTAAGRPVEGSSKLRFVGREGGGVYRFTLFSAMGYLSSVTTVDDAEFDLVFELLWLPFDPTISERFAQALRVPTTFDLSTRFPLLIEAGEIVETPAGAQFVTRARAPDFLWLTFDREFGELIAGRPPR